MPLWVVSMENTPVYGLGLSSDEVLAALESKSCTLLFADPCYQPPSAAEVAGLIKVMGWSQRQVANIVGVASNQKGSSAVRKWKTTEGMPEHRAIPYAAWRLLLLEAGVVSHPDSEIP